MPKTIYTHCLHCNTKLTGYQLKYCSKSCSAKVNNVKYPKRIKNIEYFCRNCDNSLIKSRNKNYCNSFCFQEYRRNQTKLRIEKGEITESSYLKKYLIEKNGHQCESCELTTWLNRPIPLEIHHIDGDKSNNDFSNLIIICGNCHRLTDNYGSKNKNNPLGKEIRQKRMNSEYYSKKSG